MHYWAVLLANLPVWKETLFQFLNTCDVDNKFKVAGKHVYALPLAYTAYCKQPPSHWGRPSKCHKFYTMRISGRKNLRQKMLTFGQNWYYNKFPNF